MVISNLEKYQDMGIDNTDDTFRSDDLSNCYHRTFNRTSLDNEVSADEHYGSVEWSAYRQKVRFIDGDAEGKVFTGTHRDFIITVEDTDVTTESDGDHKYHSIDIKVNRGGKVFNYSVSRVCEQAIELFGSYTNDEFPVDLDESRTQIPYDERMALETIPDKMLRDIVLSTITRETPKILNN
ncbi:hypothetical protein CMI37_37660 [Candidatus Pacearchaeota archaeon]|nr:hypothetical protein [Candidatus Pacearchaeota archaeon]|tara:strand:- start:5670 stop:6215 length:546 start_codon:yes stop_codon:yes gene_type:complete